MVSEITEELFYMPVFFPDILEPCPDLLRNDGTFFTTKLMRTSFLTCLLVALLWAFPAVAAEGSFEVDYFRLDNGLDVVVIPNHRAPVVSHMIWYRTGAADETAGKSGLAHFLEHLMFKGTEKIGPGEFSRIVRNNGGNDNAFTSQDYTAYYQNIARDYLELVMELESDRMQNLSLKAGDVDSERLVILEERRERIENNPQSRFGEEKSYMLNVNHPYGIPIIGWAHEIENLTHDEAVAFYKQWYVPNNAILIVSGDITMDELLPLAEKYYGGIQRVDLPERRRTKLVRFDAPRRIMMTDPRAGAPFYSIAWIAPSATTAPEESYALDLLAEILGGTSSSILYQKLAVETPLATSIGAYYDPVARDHGDFQIYASLTPGADQSTLEARISQEIASLLANGVSDTLLTEAKRRLIDSILLERDSLEKPALILGRAMTAGLGIDYVQGWPQKIEAVTADQVLTVAKKVLGPDNAPVSGWLTQGVETQ